MAEGRSNRSIAATLYLGERTVEAFGNIFHKLGLAALPDDHRRVLAVIAYLRAANAASIDPGPSAPATSSSRQPDSSAASGYGAGRGRLAAVRRGVPESDCGRVRSGFGRRLIRWSRRWVGCRDRLSWAAAGIPVGQDAAAGDVGRVRGNRPLR